MALDFAQSAGGARRYRPYGRARRDTEPRLV